MEIVIESAGSMYGDLEGIIGRDVPTFDELALPLSETGMIENDVDLKPINRITVRCFGFSSMKIILNPKHR